MGLTLQHVDRLRASCGIPVTVTRGGQTCSLVAVPATSNATLSGADGSFNVIEIDDWIIVAAEWTLTNPAYPAKGDRITVDDSTAYLVGHPDIKTPLFQNFNQLDRPALAWTVHSVPE